MVWMVRPWPLPATPVSALEPFRIANRFGLFGMMTRGRYEIEFQGSDDGQTWLVYPFRFKPQDPAKPPGIYAPYQPRFDWNLWFASLSSWRQEPIVVRTEQSLLRGDCRCAFCFLRAIHSRTRRRARCARLSGNTGSQRQRKNDHTGHMVEKRQLGLLRPNAGARTRRRIVVLQWPAPDSSRQ